MIKRRIGAREVRSDCNAEKACPDVFELQDGRIAIIGVDVTREVISHLPNDAGCAAHERIVILDADVLTRILKDRRPN